MLFSRRETEPVSTGTFFGDKTPKSKNTFSHFLARVMFGGKGIAPVIGYELGPENVRPINPEIFAVPEGAWELLRDKLAEHYGTENPDEALAIFFDELGDGV